MSGTRRVERAITPASQRRDCGDRNLIAGGPAGAIGLQGHAAAPLVVTHRVFQEAIGPAVVPGYVGRTVIAHPLPGKEQFTRSGSGGSGDEEAGVVVSSGLQLNEVRRQMRQVGDLGVPRSREVARVRKIGALPVGDARHQLRNQPVQIHVALPVGVTAEVHRRAVDGGGEIRAVVEVEAPQVVLVGLATAGVGGDDHAWHGLQQLPLPQERALEKFLAAHHPAAGGNVAAYGFGAARRDDHALDSVARCVCACACFSKGGPCAEQAGSAASYRYPRQISKDLAGRHLLTFCLLEKSSASTLKPNYGGNWDHRHHQQ